MQAATRFLGAQGFSPAEAGNLVAYQHGLAPVAGGWTADEIARLLFLGFLVRRIAF